MKKDKDGDHDCSKEYAASSGKNSKQTGKAKPMQAEAKAGKRIGPANSPAGRKKP